MVPVIDKPAHSRALHSRHFLMGLFFFGGVVVAPGGSWRLLVAPGGSWWLLVASWLRGFLASWLFGFWLRGFLASCLFPSLVHGSYGSSGFFGSYGSWLLWQ